MRGFDREEIVEALDVARRCGFEPTGELDLTTEEKVVHWREFDLRYTFIVFTLRKRA